MSKKDKEIEISLDIIKKKWNIILLLIIVALGLHLMLYHLDYPVVGYHNWKETHYLTEARNFAREGFFEWGFFVPARDFMSLKDDASGAHFDTFPTISILAALSFMIFGIKLWAARIIGVLCIAGTIVFMYLLVKELFKREDLALTAAALTAINPMFVFFSHNVQLVNPGVFFMMGSAYFYVLWCRNNSNRDMILASVFFAIATLSKYTFAVIAIPMLFVFPFKRLNEFTDMKKIRENAAALAVSAVALLTIPLWLVYSHIILPSRIKGTQVVGTGLINIGVLFSGQWWTTLSHYVGDNYTHIGFLFAMLGAVLFLLMSLKRKRFEQRFMLGYLAGLAVFIIIMSEKLGGHSYHEYPVAPLIIFMMSYAFVVIASTVEKSVKVSHIKLAVIGILFIIVLLPSLEAKNRQFDTQFYGLDVAGQYIKEHSQPDERIFYSDGQTYGILWHADRKGFGEIPSLEDLKFGEENLNFRWLLIYAWDMGIMKDEERWNYIKENYDLKQAGFVKQGENTNLIYLLLKKGEGFGDDINEALQKGSQRTVNYELHDRTQQLIVVTI